MLSTNNSPNYQRVKDIFIAALEISTGNRAEFLAKNCADKNLLEEVESLLKARSEAGEFLNDISAAETVRNLIDKNDKFVGQKIGNYCLEKEIGRGGMGIVFLATREDFHQQAALKLIKRGMDSDAILDRFTRERKILAALNHPFIARLTDGGTTNDNLPYFVMEFVDGVSVDEFCRNNNLSENEILELFRKICEAVAFAHQKLVVHRDLKPSNILVTADGTPKLLDFGIAKLLNSTDANETQTNQRVLTPAYASPEQIKGEQVDTTSDVYSLGKILAELLQTSESKPNSKITEKNNQKKTNTLHLSVSTDLQAVLQTALREEPSRRYNSVEKFGDDIRRYQNDLPVSARKDSFSYRAEKFVRRNSFAVFAALFLVLSLLGGLSATLWQAHNAEIERNRAEAERERAERRTENLRKLSGSFVIELHNAISKLPGSLPVRQLLLQRGIEQLDALAQDAEGNADLQNELAQGYYNLGELPDLNVEDTERNRQKGVTIYQNLLTREPQNLKYRVGLANGMTRLADIQKMRGDVAGALNYLKKSNEILEQVVADAPENLEFQSDLLDSLTETAGFLNLTGQPQAALEIGQRGSALCEKLRQKEPKNEDFQILQNNNRSVLATSLTQIGNYEAARLQIQAAYEEDLANHLQEPHNVVFRYNLWASTHHLAVILNAEGNTAAALELLSKARQIIEQLADESPQDTGYRRNTSFTLLTTGRTLIHAGQFSEALTFLRRSLNLSDEILAKDSARVETICDLAAIHGNLGEALIKTGNQVEGLKHLNEAILFFDKAHASQSADAALRKNYNETLMWLNSAVAKETGLRKNT